MAPFFLNLEPSHYPGRFILTLKRGRPPSLAVKEHINIRIDTDVLNAFKKGGTGWQTRVNNALREWLKSHV
jgi:uncharacterized protein (DUF4415 family)